MQNRNTIRGLLLAILGLGLILRVVFLSVHGIDADDTYSLAVASNPFIDFLRYFTRNDDHLVIDVHGKIYYLLYNPWLSVAGHSHISARVLNLLLEALLGSYLMSSARDLFNTKVALITGVLWALNPTLIANVEIMRMYSLLALVATVGWTFLIRAISRPQPATLIVAGLGTLAAALTHVVGLVALAAALFTAGIWAVARRRLAPLIVLVIAGLLYLPYFLNLWVVRSYDRFLSATGFETPFDFVRLLLNGLIAHQFTLPELLGWLLTGLCAFLLVRLWSYSRQNPKAAILLAIIVGSIAGAGYFALGQAVFQLKYLSYLTPVLLLGLAIGLANLPYRIIAAVGLASLMLLEAGGIVAQTSPWVRDNYPDAALTLEGIAGPNDIVVVLNGRAKDPLDYYYRGAAPAVAPWFDMKQGEPAIGETLNVSQHDTAWLVLYAPEVYDPKGVLDSWFRERYPVRTEVFPTGLTVRGYDLRPMTETLPDEASPLNVVFDERLALRGYQSYFTTLTARDNRLHPPSGWVHITLYWESLTPAVDFAPAVQMEDALGQVWGINLTRPNDVFAFYPTVGWQSGQIWRTDLDVNLNPETPPGEYQIILRAGAPGSGQFWADQDGNTAVLITTVTILPSPLQPPF